MALDPSRTDAILSSLINGSKTSASADYSSEDLACLFGAFRPAQPSAVRSKAYLALSILCPKIRAAASASDQTAGTSALVRTFLPLLHARLADPEEAGSADALAFLTALFQVDAPAAAVLLTRDDVVASVAAAIATYTSTERDLQVAHLLGQASGHKLCRAAIPAPCVQWLEHKSRQTSNVPLRAAASVALIKLAKGTAVDSAEVQSAAQAAPDAGLVAAMKSMIVGEHDVSSLPDAIEGLAYSSTDAAVKEALAKDRAFLRRLFSLLPQGKASSGIPKESYLAFTYGVVTIVLNLCAYRPRLSAEEAQVDRLRRMAKAGAGASGKLEDPDSRLLDDDAHVKSRGRVLVHAGVADMLTAAIKLSDSRAVRLAAGKALLHLAEDKENRGKILQSGGAKSLMAVIRGVSAPGAESLDTADLETIQALAKLAITASPVQVFGPDAGATYDAVRPLSLLVTHPSATLLQRFEGLMALTNLSSEGPETAARIAATLDLLNKVDILLLEDHAMVRRAAMELLCNLVAGSEDVFARYGGSGKAKSRLQVLVALADVDDLPTRLAASGALATLTMAPAACQSLADLQSEHHRVLPTFAALIDPSLTEAEEDETVEEPDPGLVHRAVVCVRNLLVGTESAAARQLLAREAEEAGLTKALVGVVKAQGSGGNPAVLRPAAEALKALMECGIAITV